MNDERPRKKSRSTHTGTHTDTHTGTHTDTHTDTHTVYSPYTAALNNLRGPNNNNNNNSNTNNNNTNKPAKTSKPKAAKKTSEAHSWGDIFAQFKLVLSFSPRDLQRPEIVIRFAQSDFQTNFGYAGDALPLPLHALYGKATIRFTTLKLQNAFLCNKSTSEYINLYKRNGVPLSCHVTLTCITGRTNPVDPATTIATREKWGVLTVRSASVVGNSKLNGIGLLGIHKISSEKLHERPETQRSLKEKEKKERMKELAGK